MNKDDFIRLISSENPVDRQMLAEINELVNVFPYFQTAHLLLLKGLHDNSDVKFENQLKNSAIHIADREVLYNLLQIVPEYLNENMPVNAEIQAVMPVPSETEGESPGKPFVKEEPVPVDESPASLETSIAGEADTYEPGIVESQNDDQTLTGSQQTFPDQKESVTEPQLLTDNVDIEQVVIESGKNSEDLINEFEKKTVIDDGNEIQTGTVDSSIIISQESDSGDSFSTLLIINEDTGEVEEKIFYMDPGFSVDDPDLLQGQESPEAEMTEAKPAMDTFPEPEESEKIQTKEAGIIEIPEKQKQADLIDKFILANPRIEPRKEKFDLPVEDLSKPFTEEEGGFVTETLARIYINQGYYSKAIEIYEKLSLKFPEKSSYFATQIERIKENYK
jgi:hypothetical protein